MEDNMSIGVILNAVSYGIRHITMDVLKFKLNIRDISFNSQWIEIFGHLLR